MSTLLAQIYICDWIFDGWYPRRGKSETGAFARCAFYYCHEQYFWNQISILHNALFSTAVLGSARLPTGFKRTLVFASKARPTSRTATCKALSIVVVP